MKDIEELKKKIEDLEIHDLAYIIRMEPLIAGKTHIEIMNDEQKRNLRSKLLEIANLVLELAKMEEKYLKEKVRNQDIILKEILKRINDLDIPKDVKKRIKNEVFKLFLT